MSLKKLNNHRWQDYEALLSQGQIYDRTQEKLATSDGNILVIRKIVKEAMEAVRTAAKIQKVSGEPLKWIRFWIFSQTVVGTTWMSEEMTA